MTDLKNIKHVYFIGIGGIGMSALARFFRSRGVRVSGYDRTPSPLTRELEESGAHITYVDSADGVPADVDTVVFTPAIPADNAIRAHFTAKGLTLMKRSDILQVITAESFNICIAGTHGKTTTSTMTAHLLRHSGYGCNAFLGGISANYKTNFWSDPRNTAVIEADEYDRSFLKLSPDLAVISAMDPDHLDIYGTAEAMEDAFIAFSARVRAGGTLFCRAGLKREKDLHAPRQLSYAGDGSRADVYASDLQVVDGAYRYNVVGADWSIHGLALHMGGLHNVENSVAAIAIAHELGIAADKIKDAIATFRGVKRRFEQVVNRPGVIYVDDYAHHPEELRALIEGVRSLFPGKKCTVVFQPHLFTRTRDLADEFAQSLDLADEVVLLPIYPAREKPIPGVNANTILDRMRNPDRKVMEKEELMAWIGMQRPELLVTAGAGDIDQMTMPIADIMNKN